MTERTIFCVKLQKEAPGLPKPPLPGELGEQIFSSVSKEAWQLWMHQQTLLINEHRLNLMEPKARSFLQDELRKFLFENSTEKPAGYVAPK